MPTSEMSAAKMYHRDTRLGTPAKETYHEATELKTPEETKAPTGAGTLQDGWRVFLSYRSNAGDNILAVCDRMYQSLTGYPYYEEEIGRVYYSPRTLRPGENFIRDISKFMQNVEYFIIPLTKEYFKGMWLDSDGKADPNCVTRIEIKTALKNRNCRFICITFGEYNINDDLELLKKLFGPDYVRISASAKIPYSPKENPEEEQSKEEENLFREVYDTMAIDHANIKGMPDFLRGTTPNVLLTSKKETEDSIKFPFHQRLYGVTHMTLLNYAGTSFISSKKIADVYRNNSSLAHWFDYWLSRGEIEATVILTEPHCAAAQDAALYKMYPRGQKVKPENIILDNLNELFSFMEKNPYAKLNVYLTPIALPYAVMLTEYTKKANNYMKIDLYSAVTGDDCERPSFYMLESSTDTEVMYQFFENNVRNIKNFYSYQFKGHPSIEWIKDHNKHIIHRGVIEDGLVPHSKRAIEACIDAQYPIEVDLLRLSDGTIVVGRDDQDLTPYRYDKDKRLSGLRFENVMSINKEAGEMLIMTLEELLDCVGGRINLLLEIKTTDKTDSSELQEYVSEIVKKLREYSCKYASCIERRQQDPKMRIPQSFDLGYAIHSSNPYALKHVKEFDCLIPCGIISTDFSQKKYEGIDAEFAKMHREGTYTEIVVPDFISYDVGCIENGIAQNTVMEVAGRAKRQYPVQDQIPIIAWTIKNKEQQRKAFYYKCENIIIEGARTF